MLVDWRESVLVGAGVWLVGFVVTALLLRLFEVTEQLAIGTVELAVLVYVEGAGGTVNEGELAASLSAYGTLDSDVFGLGPAVHMLVPAVVLLAGGYILADRHIEAGTARRPVGATVAAGSLALWFALAVTLSTIIAVATTDQRVSVHLEEVLVVTLLYAGVFALTGGAIRTQVRLTSPRGLLAGVGAFAVTVLAWLVGTDPFADRAATGLADISGVLGYLDLLRDALVNNGIEEGEILPAVFVLVVPLVFGAGLACAAGRRDPLVGAGEGARLGVSYAALVLFVVVGHLVALSSEFQRQGGNWDVGQIRFVNELVAAVPWAVLLAGVVYPVSFAAVGGAVGAAVCRIRWGRRVGTRNG